ncbi:MAG: Geranylfarnesyl diphosphate synthase [Methanocella sp. PtaU1.Bin125]|nr:MAG: Geranylfarnesyl diphosphate synthase [Methanocella sp. PtaU1.Bin125]
MQDWTETKAIQEGIDRFLAGVAMDEIRQGMSHSLKTPGKRLRPLTLLLVSELNGGSIDRALNAALGMEFIHTASLIQDDILDEGMKRRGELTSHEKFGIFVAMVSADYLISRAMQMYADCDPKSVFAFGRAGQQLAEGEVLDVKSRFVRASEAYYVECVRLKTASIFASCFEVGARVAGASEEKAQICFRMGEEFGIAYQIVDDLIEFTEIDDANKKSLQQSYILPLVYMESMSREQAIEACMAQVERRIASIERDLNAFPDGEPKEKLRQVVDILRKYNGVKIR